MSDCPRLTLTALGRPNSGKTTFLVGMYAELSGGRDGYFLTAEDPDVDLALADSWDRLLVDGVLPGRNLAANLTYDFTFRDGLTPLLDLDWLDYRGGALDESRGSESGDVAGLLDRIGASDCVLFVIDAGYLVNAVTPQRVLGTRNAIGLNRMTKLYMDAVARNSGQGRPSPPIIVLITKADRLPDDRREAFDDIVEEIRELAPICFSPDTTTLICPVQLGHFGPAPGPNVDPGDIAPRALHLPMIFILAEYLRRLAERAGAADHAAREQAARMQELLTGLRSGVRAVVRRSAISAAEHDYTTMRSQSVEFGEVSTWAGRRAARLFDELQGLPVFRDGVQVSK